MVDILGQGKGILPSCVRKMVRILGVQGHKAVFGDSTGLLRRITVKVLADLEPVEFGFTFDSYFSRTLLATGKLSGPY